MSSPENSAKDGGDHGGPADGQSPSDSVTVGQTDTKTDTKTDAIDSTAPASVQPVDSHSIGDHSPSPPSSSTPNPPRPARLEGLSHETQTDAEAEHYGTKPGHFETPKIHFPTSSGVSEVSERANE